MSTSTFLEVEAKFAVSATSVVPDLTRLTGVDSIAATKTHRMSAVYYDTADLRLTRSRITLRRREGGDDDGWHLKLPGIAGRLEIHAPLGEPVDGRFDVPEEIASQVRALVRWEQLNPIAQVDNERVELTLAAADGTPVAEFCDDHVSAWSLLPGGAHSSWREWEVELVGDSPATAVGNPLLLSATQLLVGAGARVSSSPSKLAMALGDSASSAELPPFLLDADIDPESPAAAVIAALKLNRDKLHEYDPRVRRDEWDSIHQMRVATRELRSHMETFDGILGGAELKHIESELKLLAGMLGYARDAEVVEERFLRLLDSEDSDVLDETTREHLQHDMGEEYRRAHRRVVATLNSDRYLDLLDAIDALLADPPVAGAHAYMPVPQEEIAEPVTEEEAAAELQSIIETVEDEGVIDEDRSELLRSALDFSDISASEAMTARVDMVAIDIDDDWDEIVRIINDSSYSRLPVYSGSVDNIIGFLYLNRFFKAMMDGRPDDLRAQLIPPCFVYKTTRLPDVLAKLRREQKHLAVVTDEFGGTLGVITMEDVLEELVGDIWDETDEVENEVVARPDGGYELGGAMTLSDFLELLDWNEDALDDADSTTVGGWTLERFGTFPKPGDSFRYENLTVTVLAMDGRRVERVLVQPDPPEDRDE